MAISLKFLDHIGNGVTPTDKEIEQIAKKDELVLQRAAAVAFAEELVDRPLGASPSAIVNHALATYLTHGRTVDPKKLKAIGKGLKALTKMGVPWNETIIPFPMLDEMGLPKPKNLVEENALHVVSGLLDTVCEARKVPSTIGLRAEVWQGRSGRLKVVMNGHREVGYVHRPGQKGTWTVYQDIGENAKKLASGIETKALTATVKKLFGGDSPEEVVVEGPVATAAKAVGSFVAGAAKQAGQAFVQRAAQRSGVVRTAVAAVQPSLLNRPVQVRSKAPVNGLRPGGVYTVKPSEKQVPGRKTYDFVDDKGNFAASMDDKQFQQHLKTKGFETVGNAAPVVGNTAPVA